MAHAVSRRPLTTEDRVRSQVSPCEICGGWNVTETFFSLRVLRFSPVSIIPPMICTHLHDAIHRMTNGRSLGTIRKVIRELWKERTFTVPLKGRRDPFNNTITTTLFLGQYVLCNISLQVLMKTLMKIIFLLEVASHILIYINVPEPPATSIFILKTERNGASETSVNLYPTSRCQSLLQ